MPFSLGCLADRRNLIFALSVKMADAHEERSFGLVFLKLFPQFEPMRSEPVFQELVRKIGLP